MNRRGIPAIVVLALALVLAIGSQTFFGACVHEDGSFGACHWAGKAILGEGSLLIVLAALAMILGEARMGLYLAMLPTSALGFITPDTLIDLCQMDSMRCRMLLLPATRVLCVLCLLAALAGLLLCRRKGGRA